MNANVSQHFPATKKTSPLPMRSNPRNQYLNTFKFPFRWHFVLTSLFLSLLHAPRQFLCSSLPPVLPPSLWQPGTKAPIPVNSCIWALCTSTLTSYKGFATKPSAACPGHKGRAPSRASCTRSSPIPTQTCQGEPSPGETPVLPHSPFPARPHGHHPAINTPEEAKTHPQAELFPLPVQMFHLLLEHHHVLGEDEVCQLRLHGLQLLHVVGPVCQRLLQLLHGNAPAQALALSSSAFQTCSLIPCLACGGGEQGMCSRLCRALQWGWAGQDPREITGTPLEPH